MLPQNAGKEETFGNHRYDTHARNQDTLLQSVGNAENTRTHGKVLNATHVRNQDMLPQHVREEGM